MCNNTKCIRPPSSFNPHSQRRRKHSSIWATITATGRKFDTPFSHSFFPCSLPHAPLVTLIHTLPTGRSLTGRNNILCSYSAFVLILPSLLYYSLIELGRSKYSPLPAQRAGVLAHSHDDYLQFLFQLNDTQLLTSYPLCSYHTPTGIYMTRSRRKRWGLDGVELFSRSGGVEFPLL